MALISGEGVGRHYGAHEVFRGLCFQVEEGDRIGLVGPNGGGKTTLLRILSGAEEPSWGQVQSRRGLRVGYLPQVPPSGQDTETLWAHLLGVFEPLRRTEAEIHELSEQLSAEPSGAEHDRLLARLSVLQADFEHRGGYSYQRKMETVLSGLGFSAEQREQRLGELSGGQRTRALLARLLLEAPEVLLLDEPTNHLDLDAIEWLEEFLARFEGTLVVVSHDRFFLDKLAARVWEICFGTLETYRGNYSAYTRQREERYAERLARWEAQQEYIEKTRDFVRRYGAGQRSKEARGRQAHLEKFLEREAIGRPPEASRIRVEMREAERGGDLVLRARSLVAGYDRERPLLRIPELDLVRGRRVALVGANGSGKTTLVRTLLGDIPPLSGTVKRGASIAPGYLSQTHADLDENVQVLEAVRAVRPAMKPEQVRSYLGQYLFCGDDVFKRIGDLSGGQRSRVALARLALAGANLLMLDEPTNHLDIPSQEVLQEVLREFDGTVLFVSHDRYLVDALATDLWIIAGGEVRAMAGNWSDYLRVRGSGAAPGAADEPGAAREAAAQAREDARREMRRRSRLAARHKELEAEIHGLEQKLAELGARIGLAGEAQDLDAVRRLGDEYRAADERLQALMAEWVETGESLGQAGPGPEPSPAK
ncbi:MAG TPA: ABC-F family ATP-binding cassette domain-containing protein [Planctomycetota bacterium]|nr:ABC-F family ATP-binding cassette domain-containing protein [Planctomycetota bacterium]